MIVRIALLLVIAPASAAFAQTTTACPWFTSGSAARVLGGEVTVTARATGNWEGSCHFSRTAPDAQQAIDIMVGKVNTHPCSGGGAKINSLGNDAVQCQRMTGQAQPEATIAGRIRDTYFVVSIVNVPEAGREPLAIARPSDPYGASMLEVVAEQVAGNLY